MSQVITDYFQADHQRLDLLFEQFKSLHQTQPKQSQAYLLRFQQDLEQHIDWEERQLFPLFEQRTGMMQGPTHVMRIEHKEIKALLNNLVVAVRDGSALAQPLISELERILSDHNHKEEYILYPNLDKVATEQDKAEVFLQLQK